MRRDEPSRHGRAADALIASYLRELLEDDEREAVPAATPPAVDPVPMVLSVPAQGPAADAVL